MLIMGVIHGDPEALCLLMYMISFCLNAKPQMNDTICCVVVTLPRCRCRALYEKYLEWNPANAQAWLK